MLLVTDANVLIAPLQGRLFCSERRLAERILGCSDRGLTTHHAPPPRIYSGKTRGISGKINS